MKINGDLLVHPLIPIMEITWIRLGFELVAIEQSGQLLT